MQRVRARKQRGEKKNEAREGLDLFTLLNT